MADPISPRFRDALSQPTPTFDPPEGWDPPSPPTDPREAELLEEAFGAPVDGVYAPHVEA